MHLNLLIHEKKIFFFISVWSNIEIFKTLCTVLAYASKKHFDSKEDYVNLTSMNVNTTKLKGGGGG